MMQVRFPGLSAEAWLAVDGRRKVIEGWLFDAKHATYGLSLLRILYGLLMMGLLDVNFADRQYIWGVGSRWLQPLVDEEGFTRPFTLFSGNSPGLFTATYLLMGFMALLFTLGWRTRLVTPVLLVLWVSLTHQNPLVDGRRRQRRPTRALLCLLRRLVGALVARRPPPHPSGSESRPCAQDRSCRRDGRTCSTTRRSLPWPAKSLSSMSRRPCLRPRVVCGRTELLSTTPCTCVRTRPSQC